MDVFLTVKFKLHNPSRRKRTLMLDFMRSAHLGYDKLLRSVERNICATIGLPKLFDRIKAAQEGSEEHRKLETDALKKEIRDGMLKGRKLTAEKKVISTKLQACERAVLTLGGMGYARKFHAERYLRECYIARIAPVSREMILNYIAERVLELPRSY